MMPNYYCLKELAMLAIIWRKVFDTEFEHLAKLVFFFRGLLAVHCASE